MGKGLAMVWCVVGCVVGLASVDQGKVRRDFLDDDSVAIYRERFYRQLDELDGYDGDGDVAAAAAALWRQGNASTDTDEPLHLSHTVGQYVEPDRQFFVYWIYQDPFVHFFMATPHHHTWLGVGFNFDKTMLNADVIVGSLNENGGGDGSGGDAVEAVLSDRHCLPDRRQMPVVDPQQDALLIQGTIRDQWTVLEFRRLIVTTDKLHDHPLDQVKYLLWAVGPPGSEIADEGNGDFPYHSKRGVVAVHFPSGHSLHIDDLPKEEAHASLMLYAWGLFAVIAIFCSRYMKDSLGSWWFIIHATLAALVFMLTFAAFGIIISYMQTTGGHFTQVHHITGLVVVILLLVQLGLGLAARFTYDSEREHAPLIPDKIHWWLGRITVTAAFLNIFTGFHMFSKTGTAPWILLLIWIVLIVAFVALFEVYYRGDVPNRSTISKEYQLVELTGVQLVQQNDQALLFCFMSLILTGVLAITLSVSLLEK